MSVFRNFISAAVEQGSLDMIVRDCRSTYLLEEEQGLYLDVMNHVNRYGRLPSFDTLRTLGHRLRTPQENAQYYFDRLKQRYVYNVINDRHPELRAALQDRNVEDAMDVLREMVELGSSVAQTQGVSSLVTEAGLVAHEMQQRKYIHGLVGAPTGWDTLDRITLGYMGGDVIILAGRPSMGKAQPLTSLVFTQSGWRTMGEISLGDSVPTPDGKEAKVIQIHPQGYKKVYQVEFSNGDKVECCGDHLWAVKSSRWNDERVRSIDEIIELQSKVRHKGRLSVPLTNPVYMKEKPHTVHPYVIGVLLAEGGLTGGEVRWTCEDDEVHDLMSEHAPFGYFAKPYNDEGLEYCFRQLNRKKVSDLRKELARLGMMGCGALYKRIPSDYLYDSVENRWELIRGIMDGDGTVEKSGGTPSISTSSYGLALDIKELIESLGGLVRISPRKTNRSGSYRLFIRIRNPWDLFSLQRKAQLTKVRKIGGPRKTIKSITPIGEKHCQCITLDNDEGLYLTNNFTVTHNSWLLNESAFTAWESGKSILVVSMEMSKAQMVRRWMGRHVGINPNYIRQGQVNSWVEGRILNYADNVSSLPRVSLIAGDMDKQIDGIEAAVAEHNPDMIYVDSAYLLTPSGIQNRGISKWESIGKVIGQLKQIGIRYDRPVKATVQFNRNVKNNSAKDLDLSDIGGSDSIPQDSSIVIGARMGLPPYEKSRRRCSVMKNREGDTCDFHTNFGFAPPSMHEVYPEVEDEEDMDWMTIITISLFPLFIALGQISNFMVS